MSKHHFNIRELLGKKPEKPYPDFPLFAHANGTWAKKIRGKLHYFGVWADPDAALAKYLDQKDALYAGRTPRPTPGAAMVRDVCNAFLNLKQQLRESGELSRQTWDDYKRTSDVIVETFGKNRLVTDLRPDDFAALRNKFAQRWGPVRLGNEIQRTRCIFKYAFDSDMVDRPVRFGPGFMRPSGKTLRIHRAKVGVKLLEPAELHRLMDAATVPVRAMLLLGLNCGFGNHDVATLPLAALDLDAGWVRFPRPKTGIPRQCPLWPETVAAVRAVLASRPTPMADTAGLLFLRPTGRSWLKGGIANPVSYVVRDMLKELGMHRQGRGFYTLRHVFRTVADEAGDQPAIDLIMGHHDPSMAGHYRERISSKRLRAVTDYVRAWLFAGTTQSTVTAQDEE